MIENKRKDGTSEWYLYVPAENDWVKVEQVKIPVPGFVGVMKCNRRLFATEVHQTFWGAWRMIRRWATVYDLMSEQSQLSDLLLEWLEKIELWIRRKSRRIVNRRI